MTLEVHPLADLVESMTEAEYHALREDIRENGLHEPITLYEGKILDGRHRYRACRELGIEPDTWEYEGDDDDAAHYVVSLNVVRRHLTNEQKQKIGRELEKHFKPITHANQMASGYAQRDEAEGRIRQAIDVMESEGVPVTKTGVMARAGANFRTVSRVMDGDIAPVPAERQEGVQSAETQRRGEATVWVAEAVGLTPRTFAKAQRVARQAPDLIEKVDAGEMTIDAAHEELSARLSTKEERERSRQESARHKLTMAIATLNGIAAGIPTFDLTLAIAGASDADMEGWLTSLDEDMRAFRSLKTRLEAAQNERA